MLWVFILGTVMLIQNVLQLALVAYQHAWASKSWLVFVVFGGVGLVGVVWSLVVLERRRSRRSAARVRPSSRW